MQETAHREGESRLVALAFIGGILTASVIAFAFFVFLGSRIGFQTIWEKTGVLLTGAVLEMPDELIVELTAMNAVIGNAGNPTGAKEHDTIVSRPDDELAWVLRPNVSVDVIANFESLKDRFPGGIVVALLTYLEYTGTDALRAHGWRRERIEAADRLRAEFPAICSEAGFAFVDWTDIAKEIRQQEGTIFSPWALYGDHAHLSVRGNRLFAERIHAAFSGEPQGRRPTPRPRRQST